MNYKKYSKDNIGKSFKFTNGFLIDNGVILENFLCTNNYLGTENIYKVFYINNGNYRIRYVPHSDIVVSDNISEITENEINLRLKYRWAIEDIEDYWYNFVNYTHIKV